MMKLSYGAFALAALGATSQATDSGWSGLDQEINNLSASLASQDMAKSTGPKVSGYIITSLDFGDGDDLGLPDDLLGFDLRNVRVTVKGDLGHDYSYQVSFDLGSDSEDTGLVDGGGDPILTDGDNPAQLRDAYVEWKIAEGFKGKMGRYKVPFVRSGLVSKRYLLFLDRTFIGDILDFRDEGFMLSGQFEMLSFYVNAMNGSDGQLSEFYYNGRVTLNLMGEGVGQNEGAYGAGDETNLFVGAGFGDDSGLDDGVHWAVEAVLTTGPFAVQAEIADFEADILGADATPFDVTASFMFSDQYEIGVRYEDHDDAEETTAYGLVVNRYIDGHNIKWTLQWRHFDLDAPAGPSDSADIFSLGLTVGF